jgi:hypothetical protein
MTELTQEELKRILSYDPETGIWTWRGGRKKVRAGMVAGTINKGYRIIRVGGRNYRSCRLAWLYMTGEWPPGIVDHKDRDPGNDRWDNFRLATKSQNGANREAQINNALGVKGVLRDKRRPLRPFRARIKVQGKHIYLGEFPTIEQAKAAYDAAALRYFGDFGVAA